MISTFGAYGKNKLIAIRSNVECLNVLETIGKKSLTSNNLDNVRSGQAPRID